MSGPITIVYYPAGLAHARVLELLDKVGYPRASTLATGIIQKQCVNEETVGLRILQSVLSGWGVDLAPRKKQSGRAVVKAEWRPIVFIDETYRSEAVDRHATAVLTTDAKDTATVLKATGDRVAVGAQLKLNDLGKYFSGDWESFSAQLAALEIPEPHDPIAPEVERKYLALENLCDRGEFAELNKSRIILVDEPNGSRRWLADLYPNHKLIELERHPLVVEFLKDYKQKAATAAIARDDFNRELRVVLRKVARLATAAEFNGNPVLLIANNYASAVIGFTRRQIDQCSLCGLMVDIGVLGRVFGQVLQWRLGLRLELIANRGLGLQDTRIVYADALGKYIQVARADLKGTEIVTKFIDNGADVWLELGGRKVNGKYEVSALDSQYYNYLFWCTATYAPHRLPKTFKGLALEDKSGEEGPTVTYLNYPDDFTGIERIDPDELVDNDGYRSTRPLTIKF